MYIVGTGIVHTYIIPRVCINTGWFFYILTATLIFLVGFRDLKN